VLPDGWRESTVGQICQFRNGHGFGPNDWDTQGLPIIRIQNLNGGKEFDYFSRTPEPSWLVEPGQILFSWAGTRGVSFGPCVWQGQLGVLNQHIFKVEPAHGIHKGWLYWVLRHVTNRIEAQAHGFKATLLHVKKSDIERQKVIVPPAPAQRRIAQVLACWDEAITTTEGLLANSRGQKQALMRDVLAGRKRFSRFSVRNGWQATPHGRIPIDWSYPQIAAIAMECGYKLGSREAFPVLSCTKHQGLVDSLRYFNKQVFSTDTSNYKVVPRGCFVYATNHIEEGSIGYQDLYEHGLVSPMYTVFKAGDQVDDGYLFRLLKTEHYRQIFAAATNASVDRRGSLRWNEFRKLHVPIPPMAEQRAIAELLALAESEIKVVSETLRSFRAQKEGLMAQLLTGKRRLLMPNPAGETVA
jgi:type I restriction enzyme, S subunit